MLIHILRIPRTAIILAAGMLASACTQGQAGAVFEYTRPDSDKPDASATFTTHDVDGQTILTIVLENLAETTDAPAAVLTGVDFNISGNPGLNFTTVGQWINFGDGTGLIYKDHISTNPSEFFSGGKSGWLLGQAHLMDQPTRLDSNGERVFETTGTEFAISAIGGDVVIGVNLLGDPSGANSNYGLVGGSTPLPGGPPMTNFLPLVRSILGDSPSSLIFTLTANTLFTESDITNVKFHFGSDPQVVPGTPVSEGEVPGVPEPGTLALLAIGTVGIGGYVRRRKAG